MDLFSVFFCSLFTTYGTRCTRNIRGKSQHVSSGGLGKMGGAKKKNHRFFYFCVCLLVRRLLSVSVANSCFKIWNRNTVGEGGGGWGPWCAGLPAKKKNQRNPEKIEKNSSNISVLWRVRTGEIRTHTLTHTRQRVRDNQSLLKNESEEPSHWIPSSA